MQRLSIGHANVRGLCKHLNEVKILLENTPLDVLALTETHLNSNISDNELRIDGYNIKRKDRVNREGGGCAIYYKESLDIEEMGKYNTVGLEALWIEAKLCSQRLLIGCVYRPPDVTTFYDKFQTLLENIWLTRKNIAIAGDFNSDMLPRNQSEGGKYLGKKLKNILGSFDLKNVIKRLTRVTDTTKTILDLIIVSDMSKLQSSGVLGYKIADHKFVYAILKLRKKNTGPVIRTVKNYKTFNKELFRQDISNAPWWVCSTFEEIDDNTWAWDNMYKNVVKDHVSTRKAKIRQKSLPWIDGKLHKEMNKRYKLLKACDGTDKTSHIWLEYKKVKNKVTRMIRKAEAQYWKKQFKEAQEPKDFWKLVNKIKGKKTNARIGLLNYKNGHAVTSDHEKAGLMNTFFINIGKELAAKFASDKTENKMEHIYHVTPTVDHILIDNNKLNKDLRKIKLNKASGHDNNSSRDFAAARVLTAFKKGVQSEISNYRLLSMLSIPGKLLESQACKIIDDHLDAHELLSDKQWGFRKGCSAEGLLMRLTENWKREIDDEKMVGVVFIDFKKAFDTVPHEVLSYKLQAVGITGNLHQWIMDYLSERTHYTEINGSRSETAQVKYSVPQGSQLGPCLYSIDVNDFPESVDAGDLSMFADDTNVYCIGTSVEEVVEKLNVIMEQVHTWCTKNKLTVHPGKFEAILLMKTPFIGLLQPLYYGSEYIKFVSTSTCLGVVVDQKLSWYAQVAQACKNFSKKLEP